MVENKENGSNNIFTQEAHTMSIGKYYAKNIFGAILRIVLWLLDLVFSMVLSLGRFFKMVGLGIYNGVIAIGRFFKRLGHKFKYNDNWGRGSYFVFGLSALKNKQIVTGVSFIIFQVVYNVLFFIFGVDAISLLSTLGSNESYEDDSDDFAELIVGDNSIMILIFGLLWCLSLVFFAYIWYRSVNNGYSNYRVKNLLKYEDLYKKNETFGTKLENDIIAISNDHVSLSELNKKNAKDLDKNQKAELEKLVCEKQEIDNKYKEAYSKLEESANNYLESVEADEKDYTKYLIDNSFKNASAYLKRRHNQQNRIARSVRNKEFSVNLLNKYFDKKLSKIDEKIKNADKEHVTNLENQKAILIEKNSYKLSSVEEKHNKKISDKTHKLSEIDKTYAPFIVGQITRNKENYGKQNNYFKHLAELSTEIKFYENFHVFKAVYDENYKLADERNIANYQQKIDLLIEKDRKIENIKKRFEEVNIRRSNLKFELVQAKHNYNFQVSLISTVKPEDVFNNRKTSLENQKQKFISNIEKCYLTKSKMLLAKKEKATNLLNNCSNKKTIAEGHIAQEIADIDLKYYTELIKKLENDIKNLEISKNAEITKINELISKQVTKTDNIYSKTLLAKKNASSSFEQTYQLEAKSELIDESTRISRLLNDLPNEKNVVSLEKEEIKESLAAYKRDVKYLTTSYTPSSLAFEEVVNKMIVDYKFDYNTAVVLAKKMMVKEKNSKCERFLGPKEVSENLHNKVSEKEDYIKNNPEKYDVKFTPFVDVVKDLFNGKFHMTILALPVLGIILFTIVPLIFSIIIAFTNYSKGHVPPTQLFTWIGFENFKTLFNPEKDSIYEFLPRALSKTFSWTLIWAIVATFSNYILGIIVALMINKDGIKCKKLWRTIFVTTIAIPQFISLLSIGTLLKDSGAVGTWYAQAFGSRLGFGSDGSESAVLTAKMIIILVNVWIGIPYTILSTTGILLNIPKDLYESSKVDGAGTFTQFVKITMPYILFVTGPYLITQFIGNINNFNVIFFLTGGGPAVAGDTLGLGQTDLLITFIYKIVTSTSNPQYGIASTVGILVFIVCSFISIVMYNKSGSVNEEDQFQ